MDNKQNKSDPTPVYSYEELLQIASDVMNLGMGLRQNQLAGHSSKSGKELLDEYLKEVVNLKQQQTNKTNIMKTKKFGSWEVSPKGDMTYSDYYTIGHDRLGENDWILQLMTKGWINWNDFIPAYIQALKNAGIKEVTIISQYQ